MIGNWCLYQGWDFLTLSLEAIRTPSFSLWSKIFFSATTFPVRRERALYTSLWNRVSRLSLLHQGPQSTDSSYPKVPSPSLPRNS